MRIGIDAHTLEGNRTGVGRYLINILERAVQTEWIRNNFIFYLYFKKEIPEDDFLNNPIFVKRLLNLPFNRSSFTIFFLFLLPFALKKDKIDLTFFPSYMIPLTFFGKGVITIHDLSYEDHPELYSWRYLIPYKIFSRYGAHRAKKILTVSNYSKKRIIYHYRVKPDKILVTHLGLKDKFKVLNDKELSEKTKGKYGVKDKFIFQLGQIFQRRHVYQTILAFERIAERFPQYQLLIAGKNRTVPFIDIEGEINRINHKLNREAILHCDYVDEEDIVLLYNAADVSIYLSDYEGFGLPPLEAMACGTPVMTTNLTSLEEVAGPAALLINNPKDVNEVEKALIRILSDNDLRKELVQKGLENIKRFSWQKCAEQTFNLFLSIK